MHSTPRPSFAVLSLSLLLSLALAAPASARASKQAKPTADAPEAAKTPVPVETNACQNPCAHVADCPKVTCECADATASGVAACDAENTHCCMPPATACERFCQVHHQDWTGRYTPEGSAPSGGAATGDAKGKEDVPAAPCAEPCAKGEDCRTMTCECVRTKVENVAACDFKARCCAPARIVCDHYCAEKKDKWTGKVADTPPADTGSLLDGLYDGEDEPDGGDGDVDTE